jgi:hypothetical protein
VSVDGRPLTLGDPERSRISPENRYEPQWVGLDSLDLIDLVPESAHGAVAAARAAANRP